MTHNSPILIIRLSDDKKRYSTYLIDKEETSYSYLPSYETKDISKSRELIINNITAFLKYYVYGTPVSLKPSQIQVPESIASAIDQNYVPLKTMEEFIGSLIFNKLGCDDFFRYLWGQSVPNSNINLIIVTNDIEIPWEWAFNITKKEFLCESFSVGRILLEDIKDYFNPASFSSFNLIKFEEFLQKTGELKHYIQPKKAMQNAHVALIYDSYDDDLLNEIRLTLDNVQQEIEELKKNPPGIAAIKFITESLKKAEKLLEKHNNNSGNEKLTLQNLTTEIEALKKKQISLKSMKTGKFYPPKIATQSKYHDFVKEEIRAIKKILQENYFNQDNINELNGQEQLPSKVIDKLFSWQWEKQKIIHFSLCSNGIEFYLANSRLKDIDILPSTEAKKPFFHYMPLVVLNIHGIERGADYPLAYESLAHKLLKMGASACLLTFLPIFDRLVPLFYEIFYSEIIENNASYGKALQLARNKLKEAVIKTPSKLDDEGWLFPILIGDPSLKLFPQPSDKLIRDGASENTKEIELKKELGTENVLRTLDDYVRNKDILSLLNYLETAIKGGKSKEAILEFKQPWQAVEAIISHLFHNYLRLGGNPWGSKRSGERLPDGYVIIPGLSKSSKWCFIYDCKSTKEKFKLDISIKRQILDYLDQNYEVNYIAKEHNLKYFLLIGHDFNLQEINDASNEIFHLRNFRLKCMDVIILKRLLLELDNNCNDLKNHIEGFNWDGLFQETQITKEKIQELVEVYCNVRKNRYHPLPSDIEK
ncbi:MAG: hypothetical protein WC405_08245 [Syntrophales bacterium]